MAHDVLISNGETLGGVLAAAPDPGDGTAPPGSEKIVTILEWGKWIFTAAAVLGGLIIAGRMILAHQRGDDAQMGKLGIFLAACVLAGVIPNVIDALA
ncbi:hypothetical protein BG844_09115 [Couchioplanes caeruleus subsp. caeruleus]|uniref:Conjugal transfer protein TrbC n=2 Tax=Couchioplanes caeruleus TaxID=56438 RepID=A0A1K0GQ69_9ACTN|nr:hypothetical protein BG844_09115 [Couchioplanes caeruleus subsp. caeruleus]